MPFCKPSLPPEAGPLRVLLFGGAPERCQSMQRLKIPAVISTEAGETGIHNPASNPIPVFRFAAGRWVKGRKLRNWLDPRSAHPEDALHATADDRGLVKNRRVGELSRSDLWSAGGAVLRPGWRPTLFVLSSGQNLSGNGAGNGGEGLALDNTQQSEPSWTSKILQLGALPNLHPHGGHPPVPRLARIEYGKYRIISKLIPPNAIVCAIPRLNRNSI